MSDGMTRRERKALRNQEMYRRRRREELERILKEAERELTFGRTEFPEHARPLRSPSGVRFGW